MGLMADLLADEKKRTKGMQDAVTDLNNDEEAEQQAYMNRKKNMGGGGRSGLMFRGNRQGV